MEQDGRAGAVDGDALGDRLKQRDIPFIFHSGYRPTSDTQYRGIVIPKPAHPEVLVEALLRALANQDQPCEQSATPSVLRTSRPQL